MSYTAIPAGPIAPTQGHQFTDPSVNFGGEHFGVGFFHQPTAIHYNWLIDNGAGALVHGGVVQVASGTNAIRSNGSNGSDAGSGQAACSRTECATSTASRDLPAPAGAVTSTARQPDDTGSPGPMSGGAATASRVIGAVFVEPGCRGVQCVDDDE